MWRIEVFKIWQVNDENNLDFKKSRIFQQMEVKQ